MIYPHKLSSSRKLGAWIFATISCASVITSGLARAQAMTRAATHGGGIWKVAVPPKSMKGEFDSLDPLGVAAGARIKADCSLNWINPDDGKLYCFSSGTSLEFFLDRPHASIERAEQGWRKLAAHRQ
jgi:hypothetical protein